MPVKEYTLEELIAKQQENKAIRLVQNAENIVKISFSFFLNFSMVRFFLL